MPPDRAMSRPLCVDLYCGLGGWAEGFLAAWFDGALDERRRRATALSHGKQNETGGLKVSGDWFGSYAERKADGTISPGRLYGKNSNSRKAASALIAKIPFALARHIAEVYTP